MHILCTTFLPLHPPLCHAQPVCNPCATRSQPERNPCAEFLIYLFFVSLSHHREEITFGWKTSMASNTPSSTTSIECGLSFAISARKEPLLFVSGIVGQWIRWFTTINTMILWSSSSPMFQNMFNCRALLVRLLFSTLGRRLRRERGHCIVPAGELSSDYQFVQKSVLIICFIVECTLRVSHHMQSILLRI